MNVNTKKANIRFARNNFLKNLSLNTQNYDWILVIIVSILCIAGLAFLASSLSTQTFAEYQQEFLKQLILGVGLGSGVAIFLARQDYHVFFKYSNYILLINFLLLGFLGVFAIYANIMTFGDSAGAANEFKLNLVNGLQFLPIKPHIANGSFRWIDLFFLVKFQPSELTKVVLLIYFTTFFQRFEKIDDLWLKLKRPLYAFGLSAVLILFQPDLGTVLLIFGILLSAMWAAKIDTKIVTITIAVVSIVAILSIALTGYRLQRVKTLFNLNSEQTGQTEQDGSNSAQILGVWAAIQNGGMWGKGYGNGEFKTKPGVLFEQSTDAIIAIIGEEMGFVMTLAFLSLYLFFLMRGLKIAKEAPDVGGRSLAAGVSVWIVSQAFLNIGGILGLLPLKGIPLPFVSQGGTAIMMNLMAVGILLSVSKYKITEAPVKAKSLKNS